MLKTHQPLAIYLANRLLSSQSKMGYGVLRYSPNPIACIVDPEHAGKTARDVLPWVKRDCPIVADVRAAQALGAEVLVLGLAPLGGRLPGEWVADIRAAVEAGLSILNGLHEHVRPALGTVDLRDGQWIWDIRQEPKGLVNATGAAAKLPNRRLLLVGTDMSIGKMSTGLELLRSAERRGLSAGFVATGQIGITIRGNGVPLDAIRLDFASGAIEREVVGTAADYVIVEGQGSILHPSSSATLPLIRGTCPTEMILCHKAGQATIRDFPAIRIPPLAEVARLYEQIAGALGCFPAAKVIGIAMNTSELREEEARRFLAATSAETGLPATDTIRFGAEPLLDAWLGAADAS